MMFKLLISLSLLISMTPAFSSENGLNACEKEGERFGDGKGKDLISYECADLFKKNANLEAVKTSESGKIVAFGYRNIVFLKLDGKIRVITGSYTEMNDIQALTIDEANKEVAVLDAKGDVLFFSSHITGNVAPLRILKHKELTGAADLVVNSKKNEVLILNKRTRSVIIFSRLANYHGPEKKKKLAILKVIKNLHGHESVSIDNEHQELFSFDAVKNKIQVFSLESGSQVAVRELTVPVTLKNPAKIEYSSVTDKVVVSNAAGEVASIPRQ